MTKCYNQTGNVCKSNHSTFGGRIWKKDFGEYLSMSDIASRILSDQAFDELCKTNAYNRLAKMK